ncbi:MAG: hypothetical protein DMD82_04905 [Candidatus Rokuibacteriota bacterium]|nr:MAG: hypothetical protein DMD82_04905 [Candidatus Rokubacteria bacterium]
MRRPTAVEIGLAASLVLLLVGVWLWQSDPARPPITDVHVLPARTGPEPEIALVTDEAIRLFASREFPRACDRFGEAVEREPDSPVLRGNVARCFERWGWHALRAGHAEAAILLFRQGLRQAPQSDDLLKGLGVAAIHAGRTDLAIEPLETVLRGHVDTDVALLLARLYDQRDDAARAVTHLKRLVAAHPEHVEARRFLEKLERERAVETGFSREETPHFVVKYRAANDPDGRRVLLRSLETLYAEIGTRLMHHPAEKIIAIVYPEERFQEVTRTHDWVGGLFDGKIRLPAEALAGRRDSLERLLAHEVTHAIVHQLARGRAPRWLQEGLAQHFEGVADENSLELPRGLTLAGVEALLTDGEIAKARTGYRTALWLVRDLLQRGGAPAVADLLSRLGRGESVTAAVHPVYGLPLKELEAQWRLVLGERD